MFNRKHLLICTLFMLTMSQSSIGQITESEQCMQLRNFFNTCMGSTLGGEGKAGMECFQKYRAQVGPALKFCVPN